MGLVVIYRSDTYCPPCGEQIKKEHPRRRKFQRLHDSDFDSDEFPKGPMESDPADQPLHCGECKVDLEVELTAEGEEYVKELRERGRRRKA
jgi:hypothetical protein